MFQGLPWGYEYLLLNERERCAEVVRPDDDGEHALPEGELEVADGKEPHGAPEAAAKGMILHFYFLHKKSR